ncbi:MAG TPA: SDR family NAD(P)-dependent oxidoreductase, partial [Stellaceae bacterium]|nr:SDR family NAD(P)-dependent oxidoreductase [Stellaceae bacterium]
IDPHFEHPLLGFRRDGPVPYWRNVLDPDLLPWLSDHSIEGVPVLPGAAVVEIALAAARARRPNAPVLEIVDFELRRPLPFDTAGSRELGTVVATEEGDWELSSRPRLSDEPATVHAVARITAASDAALSVPDAPLALPVLIVDAELLYALAARLGLNYGPQFRTVTQIDVFGPDRATVHLDPGPIEDRAETYLIHPALLDGALQGLLALLTEGDARLKGTSFLPWRFGRVRLAAPFGRMPAKGQLRVTRLGTRSASADILLTDEVGATVAQLTGCWMRRVELSRCASTDERVLRVELVPAPLHDAEPPPVLAGIGEVVLRRAATIADDQRSAEQALLLEALIAAVAWQSIAALVDAEAPFTVAALLEQELVAAGSVPLLDCLLRLLERFAAAEESADEWQLKATHELPDISEVWRLLLAEAPELVAELALLAAAVEELPRLIAEGPAASQAPLPPMVEQLLQASPASAAGIDLVCEAIAEIGAGWPAGRTLRILEVGASGGITRRFLDRLAGAGVSIAYLATSPDRDQAARLAFAVNGFTGASAQHWSPGEADDLGARCFDVVLAVNGSARVQLESPMLARLCEFLAPGGLLLAAEPAPNPLWDLVFGRNTEWWRTSGGEASPLRTTEEWGRELALAGFAGPRCASLAAGPWPNLVITGLAPAPELVVARPAPRLTVHFAGARDAAAGALSDALVTAGHRTRRIDLGDTLPSPTEDSEVAILVVDAVGDPVAQAAALIPDLVRIATATAENHIPLVVLTSGAQQPHETVLGGLPGAAVWGFARVLFNEMPRLSLRLIDMPARLGWAERGRLLAAELSSGSSETEVVWTETGRHVPRLRRGLPPRFAAPSEAVSLGSDQPGGLDALGWKRRDRRPPGPGEVEVEVHAAGLNFRDMMWAMGLLPEEALIDGFAGATYGLECAGIARAIGPGVEGLSVGDRVAGFAPAALSSSVITRAHALMPIPGDTSFAAAATIPVAFVTAVYALGTLAKLAEGEHVLIHAAAGGVGLAAIQYAKHRGAIVIATAGSEIKRAFLRQAGADHVLDSRALDFADGVRDLTGHAGVDVVLNSLSGDAMELSLSVLKPFGRFLELGKRDFYLNRRIHLRPMRQNISYFAIDVDQLPVQRPDLAASLLAEISAALQEGAIRPLAHRRFPFGEIDEAFRLMQSSGHIGKLVLEPSANAGVRLRDAVPSALSPDGTYLVTGGLSGFGFEAARWLVQNGARSVALLGRRGIATPGAVDRVHELTAAGAEVSVHAGDVADRAALGQILARIRAGKPLRGIVHAASAIGDGLAADVDATTVAAMLGPKLGGAILLNELTREDPLDLFLLFSSATTLLGAPGQGVYVAANHALEALARCRRAEGRPALAVAWGPIADAGYLAERPEMREALGRRLGAKPVPAAQALAALPEVIASGLSFIAVAETSWQEARRFLPILAHPMFGELHSEAGAMPSDESLLEKLTAASGDEALTLLKSVVAAEAANILRLPPAAIDPARPLSEMGMDSLMAVELRLALETRLRIDLPLVSLAEGTSVASIAGRLSGAMSEKSPHGEVIGLVERHEGLDDGAMAAAVTGATESFEAGDLKSEAAE